MKPVPNGNQHHNTWLYPGINPVSYLQTIGTVSNSEKAICPTHHLRRVGCEKLSFHSLYTLSGVSSGGDFCHEKCQAIFPSFWTRHPYPLTTWQIKAEIEISLHLVKKDRTLLFRSPRTHPYLNHSGPSVSQHTAFCQSHSFPSFTSARECRLQLVRRRVEKSLWFGRSPSWLISRSQKITSCQASGTLQVCSHISRHHRSDRC